MAQPAMSVTPAEFSTMWEVISKLRKAKGDTAGSLRAKQSAYAMRLGRAVIQDGRAARVAAINRLRDPMEGSHSTGGKAMAKAKASPDAMHWTPPAPNGQTKAQQGLTLEFTEERPTKNTVRYAEVENGHGTIVGTLYLNKSAAWLLGLSSMPGKVTITITPSA